MDKSGSQDVMDNTNPGFESRRSLCALSATVHTMAPIHSEIFTQTKLFPPNTTIGITLHQTSDDFRIMSGVPVATRTQKLVFCKWANKCTCLVACLLV